jgi:CRP/FNR family cyclic AMP-dependent transcriptional regulator
MGSRYGLKIMHNPSASLVRRDEVFCDPLAAGLKALDSIIPPVAYPKGAVLFMEGQVASGIFVVCTGQVKLSTYSREGKALILKIAEAGELLGLPATLSGKPYEVTAEVSEQARINFVARVTFLRFLREHPNAIVQVAQLLTDSHYAGHEVIQSLAFSRPASEKLARFLLSWSADHARGQDRLRIDLNQQEIGEMIGVTRETVARLLAAFKNKNLLTVKGATVNICNRAELETLAGR